MTYSSTVRVGVSLFPNIEGTIAYYERCKLPTHAQGISVMVILLQRFRFVLLLTREIMQIRSACKIPHACEWLNKQFVISTKQIIGNSDIFYHYTITFNNNKNHYYICVCPTIIIHCFKNQSKCNQNQTKLSSFPLICSL